MSDASGNLMAAAREAVESYEGLRNNTNTSNTALAQSQVAGAVTQGNLTAAIAQLLAFQAARQAAVDYEEEIARREALARRIERQRTAQAALLNLNTLFDHIDRTAIDRAIQALTKPGFSI